MGKLEDDVEAFRKIEIVPTILDTVCRLTGMGFSAVARVTDDRWIACDVLDKIGFGLTPGGELKVDTTICQEIRQSRTGVAISDVATDPVFCNHHTPALYGFRSYISVPIIRSDNSVFGTLCAIDPEPRDLDRPEIQATFRMFADLLAFHLDAVDKLATSEGRLATEVAAGGAREQFIAVVGHDLRNPIAAIDAGVTMLRKTPPPAQSRVILDQMNASVQRMSSLIDDIPDFARGRLGGGFMLRVQTIDVGPAIRRVVDELAASHPDQTINLICEPGPVIVECDPQRLEQLLSNLLGNALTHGARNEPITVAYGLTAGSFHISVTNGGEEIPSTALAGLFHPFSRGTNSVGHEGLGLGLYIASEIAKAHRGQLTAASSAEQTSFAFTAPLAAHA